MAIALAACDLKNPTSLSIPPVAPPPAGEGRKATSALVGSFSAPNAMPEPGAVTSRVELGPTGTTLQPNTYTLIRIGGTLTARGNPYKPSSRSGEGAVSYSAVESAQSTGRGVTNVWLRETGAAAPAGVQKVSYFFRPDAGGRDMVLLVRTGAKPVEMWAEREMMPGASMAFGYCMPGFPYCDPEHVVQPDTVLPRKYSWIEDFWIVTSHLVTATQLSEPLLVEGPAAVTPGSTASFSAQPWEGLRLRDRNGNPADVRWLWYPNDTTGTPSPNISPATICSGQSDGTCHFAPTTSGRLRAWSYVEGALAETDRIVRVAQQEHAPEQPTLNLSCTPNVTRGNQVRCTARLTPAMEMVVVQRSARGPGFSFTQARADTVPAGDSASWTGTAVAPSEVRITVRVTGAGQGKVLRATGSFAVSARPWAPYQLIAPSSFTVGLRGQMTDYPSNGHLGNFGATGLNPFSTPIDSVGSGPNSGMLYFVDRPPFISSGSSIFVHPGLYPPTSGGTWGHTGAQQWYNDQNGAPSGTCSRSDVPLLRTEVERHEGVMMAANSHYGVLNQQFLARRPERRLEALYLYQVPRARLQTRAYHLYEQFIRGPAHTAQAAFDNADYPSILSKFSCQFDFNQLNH